MNLSFLYVTILSLMLCDQVALAVECSAPPVDSSKHAICLAHQFAERPMPPPWELEFTVREQDSHWLVYYIPKLGSGARGGGGELKIDKKSGQVTLISGYR
jgi:hypothetical protein